MTLANAGAGVLLLVTFLLQSCGGGGGGAGGNNPPPPPPPPGGLIGLIRQVAQPAGEMSFLPAEDAYFAMRVLTLVAQDLQSNEMDTITQLCPFGGTVRLSADDRNAKGALDAGDTISIAYTECSNSVTGSYSLEVTDAILDGGGVRALVGRAAIDITFLPGGEDLTGSGEMEFGVSATKATWNGTGFRIGYVSGVNLDALNDARIQGVLTFGGGYSFGFSGTVQSDTVGGRYHVRTGPSFSGSEGQWPADGVLVASGRDDSEIRYLANGGQPGATFEVDANGDGVIDDLAEGIDWSDLSSGFAFGISGDPDVEPQPNGPNVFGRRIGLGGDAKDIAVNPSRGQIYVTVPARDEMLVFSAATLEVVTRIHVGSGPSGLSVSPDGDEIFVGLAASGAVAVLEAATLTETARYFVAPQLESSEVYKVVETAPGILYVSSGVANSEGRIARIDRGSGVVTAVATTGFAAIELIADPAHGVMYAGDGDGASPPIVRKLDASDPATPLLAVFSAEAGNRIRRMSLDPGGSRLYLENGLVLNTFDLSRFGRIGPGIPWASDNGSDVLVASGERDLAVFSAADLRQVDTLETDCWSRTGVTGNYGSVQRLLPSPVNGQWLLLGNQVLCVVDLLNPDVPPGTGDPGVPPDPVPTVTITTASVPLHGRISDAEYDDARKRLYVTFYSRPELLTIDAENYVELERQPLGHTARGIDLSPDGSTLAIMYNDNGHIAFKDLASGTIETQDISSFLGTPRGHDVQWQTNDVLYASAAPDCCDEPYEAYLVKVSRSDSGATRRIAGGANGFFDTELALSPDGNFLYARQAINGLVKLDLTQPGEPIVASSADGRIEDPHFSPDGSQIALRGGLLLRSSDLFSAGRVAATTGTRFAADGSAIFGYAARFIDRFDPVSHQRLERMESSVTCDSSALRFPGSADGKLLITAESLRACFWRLDQPIVRALKARAHEPYACATACMMRNLRKGGVAEVRSRPTARGRLP